MDAVLIIIVALIGILAGGLVNTLADDLPPDRDGVRHNLRRPRYPDGTLRPPIAWLGLTAFIFGKRSSPDGARLSWRYPLTELLTSGLMVLCVFVALGIPEFSPLKLVFWLIFMAIYVLITVIDMEHRLILFKVINPTVIIALVYAVVTQDGTPPSITDHLIGGIAGFGVFFILYNGGFLFTYVMGKLRGREIREVAFGYGDVMLAGVSGLILGWQALIFAMFITVFLGAFGAVLYLVSRRFLGKKYSAFTAIPYGPYIVIGFLLLLLFPAQIGNFLLP